MALAQVKHQLARWGDTVRVHHDHSQPPTVGWQIPFLGCGLQYGVGGPRWLLAQHRRLGDPFTLYMLGKRFTVSQDPAFMQHFYTADVEEVSFFEALKTFPGLSKLIVFDSTGPEGANAGMEALRKFLPARVSGAGEALDEEVGEALRDALAGGGGELVAVLRRAILRMTALLLGGPRLARDPAFIDAVCDFDDATLKLVKNPLARSPMVDGPAARGRAVALVVAELQRRRASGEVPGDFADALMAMRDPAGRPFTDEQLAIELHSYMFATTANTPAAAAMCVLHILMDPGLRARIVAEQAQARRERGDTIDAAAMKGMPLLNATYLETLRLYVGPLHLRMTLGPMVVGPYTLPARSLIAFSAYVLHQDPAVYTDPEVFDPDRFLNGPRGPGKAPSTQHFVPYGRGVHTCLGRNLARQEILLAVARLLRDFDVTLEPCKRPLAADFMTHGIAMPAGPRGIRVTRRAA